MLNISELRKIEPSVLAIVSHPVIIQSILDFDFLSGKSRPSIVAIIGSGKKYERFFYGDDEVLIPLFSTFDLIPEKLKNEINLFLNNASGRRIFSTSEIALSYFPNMLGGVIFAENVPEKFSVELYQKASELGKFIVGPASVGIAIPSHIKLGAIAGTQAKQLVSSSMFTSGNVAVFAASGGMTNEVISVLNQYDKHLSFALSVGGDRFPTLSPKDAFLAAEKDPMTEYIVYYGELGGYDEYEIVELIKNKKLTKKIIAYIGGSISEMFETPPQFGHAKAMAGKGSETAQEKRKVMNEVGIKAASSFTVFINDIKEIKSPKAENKDLEIQQRMKKIQSRKKALLISTVSGEKDGEVQILGHDQITFLNNNSYAAVVVSMLLGKPIKSKEIEQFTDFALKLIVDNGPYQSGAINTMITARAGKDLVSSLVAGLLTIGPRFGGAVNEAAASWYRGVHDSVPPYLFVEDFAKQRKFIMGIGHRKHRSDFPDPRVQEILAFTKDLKNSKYTSFALEIEKITTAKKGNLILNVDGALAAVLLDLLSEKEGFTDHELEELIESEFFNAFFVLSRSVGLTAQYLDQRRLDEGLFRLSPTEVKTIKLER